MGISIRCPKEERFNCLSSHQRGKSFANPHLPLRQGSVIANLSLRYEARNGEVVDSLSNYSATSPHVTGMTVQHGQSRQKSISRPSRLSRPADRPTDRLTDPRTDRLTDRWTDWWTDQWNDRQADRPTNRPMNRPMTRPMNRRNTWYSSTYLWTDVDFVLFFFPTVFLYSPTITTSNFSMMLGVPISWGSAPDNDGVFQGYCVYYRPLQETASQNVTVTTRETSYDLTGLESSTLYSIFVRVLTLNGLGKKSNEIAAWTQFRS